MWELDCEESWVQKNWCFWTVVSEKPLESLLVARRSNQSILKEISPGCSLEGLILKLKLRTWCEELTHLKRPWWWERLKAGGEGDDRGWDGWMASPTQWTWVWVNSGSWWWTGRPGALQSMGSQRVEHDWATELNWVVFLTCESVKVVQSCPTLCHPLDYTVHGILQARITGVGSLSLLQGIFPVQESNPGLLHCGQILYHLSHKGSIPYIIMPKIFIHTNIYVIG